MFPPTSRFEEILLYLSAGDYRTRKGSTQPSTVTRTLDPSLSFGRPPNCYFDGISLQSSKFARPGFGDNFCQSQGTEAVAKLLLSSSSSLRQLDLSCQDVWDDRSYFCHIASALANKNGCGLETLDISSNFLKDEHLEWLLQALQHNRTLRRVVLRNNAITNDGMAILSKFLPQLSLTTLDLTNNHYTHVESLDLASNTSLWQLQVDPPLTARLLYYLALNQGGRQCKLPNEIPLSVWPLLLARSNHYLNLEQRDAGISTADIIFDLLHGPALLER